MTADATWVTATGARVRIRDMADSHLTNAILLLNRRWREAVNKLLDRGQVGAARLVYRAGEAGMFRSYPSLVAEAERRAVAVDVPAAPDVPGERRPGGPSRSLRWTKRDGGDGEREGSS